MIGLLVALTLTTAPVPKREPILYIPTTVGTTWVYSITVGGGTSEIKRAVSTVQTKGAETVVSVISVHTDGPSTLFETLSVSEKGLYWLPVKGAKDSDLPMALLKLPITPGDNWTSDFRLLANHVETRTTTVYGPEKVEVPAGTFTAVRTETVVTAINGIDRNPPKSWKRWYAPGVGMVSSEESDGWKTYALMSFTPGNGTLPPAK